MLSFLKKTAQYFITITIFLLLLSNISYAQSSDIFINISPMNPGYGESVRLSINSNNIDLNSSKIIWYIDDAPRRETTSQNIIIKAKSDGSKTSIKVVVETIDGIIKEAYKEISPAGIDFIIEPMSYIPPFYKGKALFASQGNAKIIAIPNIIIDNEKVENKNLIFKWSKDNKNLVDESGIGKNSIYVRGVLPIRDIDVELEILDTQNNSIINKNIIVKIDNPSIVFYENNPLYGIMYNKAITGDYYMGLKEELKIIAKPFYFNVLKDIDDDLIYGWTVNDNSVKLTGKKNELILRQNTTNLQGTANINLNLKNKTRIFQFSKNSFSVTFGQ